MICTCPTFAEVAERPHAVGEKVDCGPLATMTGKGFASKYLPKRVEAATVRASDFLKGRTHSEAIEAALASINRSKQTPLIVVLDQQDWIIDRAVLLPSNTELVIDACKLKLADGVFDNFIRVAGIQPKATDPYGFCKVEPTENIRITGRNKAIIEGADKPYEGKNPKTGKVTKWVGDFYGWRTIGILLSHTKGYEISGFTMRKTHCWAISQGQCTHGYIHDIVFQTNVKNGDGVNFRNGCAFCMVENISGSTSDDTVACTALNGTYFTHRSRYVYPLQPEGLDFKGDASDIHDIAIRNIFTGGNHHGVICLATSPRVYNIAIKNIEEKGRSQREAVVKIYTGYGSGYKKGNLSNICVSDVVSTGARYAVMVKADVKDVAVRNIKQLRKNAATHVFKGDSENLTISHASR